MVNVVANRDSRRHRAALALIMSRTCVHLMDLSPLAALLLPLWAAAGPALLFSLLVYVLILPASFLGFPRNLWTDIQVIVKSLYPIGLEMPWDSPVRAAGTWRDLMCSFYSLTVKLKLIQQWWEIYWWAFLDLFSTVNIKMKQLLKHRFVHQFAFWKRFASREDRRTLFNVKNWNKVNLFTVAWDNSFLCAVSVALH